MEQETKICSNCKRAINVGTFDLHESHCIRHIQLCPDCQEPVPIKEMEEHHKENHAPKPCDKCGQNIPPDQLEEHLEHLCLEGQVECKYCELDIRRGDYHEHSEQCGSRTDFCELCNQRVMLKEMSEHKLTKCGHMRAESPLQRYQLEGMGLLGQQDGGESDSSDDFNPNYYPPHVIGRPTTPPPPYERRNDESMHVDPHWLQTVAEACGEDNLDALLAQNVFFENMRSVRSDGNFAASGPAVVSHDNHVTTEESSEDECSIVREKPPIAHDRPGDNRLLDEDFSRQLAATNEQDDFFLAQRMQEREVMGHSRTLYEEKTVREIATEAEREERERESEEEGENSWREMEEGSRREVEEEDEEVKSKAANKAANKAEQEELERLYEDELAAKKLEIEELAKKLKESTENQKRLQKDIEERREEIDSLRLATELQKADLAEGHKALWRKTARTPQLDDERLARRLQMKEDRLQYSHTHLEEEEEPRPKSPPSQSYADDTFSEKIPCQWCAKLIPFEQVMLHQQSCYDDLFGGGMEGGHGPRLNEDTFRRVETDTESWQAEQLKIECQFCHISFSASNLTTHEALCDSNPDIHLKNFYSSQPSSMSSAVKRDEPSHTPPTTHHDNTGDLYQAQQFSVECDYCHISIPASNLTTHEALCTSNPNVRLKKLRESQPRSSSSGTALGLPSSNGAALSDPSPSFTATTTAGTLAEPGLGAGPVVAGASATLLSVEKGPCEFCHQVIPLAQLIQHEATCRYIRPKPSLAPPTSSQYSPAPPPSSPTLLQENSSSTAGATLTAGKRGLAIKFPGKEDQSDTTAHQEGDTIRRLDPVVKPASLAANDSPSPFLSSSSGKGKEFKGSKKRQSPSETFEPWLGVREPVKKVPRTEVDGGSVDSSSSTIISRSSVTAKSVAGGASGSKSKPVYAGASGRDVYGADSIERGWNVLSSAARGVPSSAIKQVVRESRSKTDTTVKSVNRGMKELSLHSKSDAESKSLSTTAAKAKPTSVTSSRNPPSKTKSLQTGNSKLQISGTKVSGTSSIPHSNATRTPTGTTGTKSVGNYSKEHSTASKKPLGVSSLGLGSSGTTKQTVGASTSARGRGRGRGQAVGTASRQSSIGGGGGVSNSVSKGIGRGRGGAGTSPSTRHRTNSSGKDNAQTKSYPQHSRH